MIRLKIMTPNQGLIFDEDVKYVDVKSNNGHIGLQQNITPMIGVLENGQITIKFENKPDKKGIVCNGTLYVDRKSGIKIFTSAFSWLDQVNEQLLISNIDKYKEQLSKMDSSNKNRHLVEEQLLTSEWILEGFKKP